MDKQEAIRHQIQELETIIKRHKRKIEILNLQQAQIQRECEHPNKRRYSAMGELGWYCPDCQWQT